MGGYTYVYIGVIAAIIAIGFFLFFYLQQGQPVSKGGQQFFIAQVPTGLNNLTLCDAHGTTPFMEGFYLQGAQPGTLKTWNWGDTKPDETTTSVVMNHDYRLNKNDTSLQFKGNVTEWDYDNPTKIRDREYFTVTVDNTNLKANYDQFEGVIIKNDYAGFSVSTPAQPTWYTWYWDKTNPNDYDYTSLDNSNPGHEYSNIGKFHGYVTLASSSVNEEKDFCIMTISNMRNITGEINVTDKLFYIAPSVYLANDDLTFVLEKTPAPGLLTYSNPGYLWSFGDKSPPSRVQPASHMYENNGTYLVKVNATDSRGYLTLSKTIVILKPTMSIFPKSGPVGTNVIINGSQFPDGNYTGEVGKNLLLVVNPTFPVTVRNGTFSLSYQIPSGTQNGSKTIDVEYLPTGKILASTNFNVTRP
jgi:PKD repeat protein